MHCNFVNGKRPCSSELKSHLDCLAKVIQCLTEYTQEKIELENSFYD